MHVKNQLPLRFIALGERTTSACRAQIIAAITQGGNGNYSMCTQRTTNFEERHNHSKAAVSDAKIPCRRLRKLENCE